MRQFFIAIALLMSSAGLSVSGHGADAPKPVKVFILAGQSNMEGQAVVDLKGKDYNDGKGTLSFLMKDPVKAAQFKHLRAADGKWTVREDVWCRYQRERGPLLAGSLTMGFSVYGGTHHFGPELQFGHIVGDHLANPVLLVKTAWGGKSLYEDFRPPSSGGKTGLYYTKMLAQINEALSNLKKDFPAYDGTGYELAGFVWYHGWNDGVDPKRAIPEYEQNLVNLINDIRKDLKAPNLPVVVGELTGPWVEAPPEWTKLRMAQAAAAERPQFRGNVLFVETRDFVRSPQDSPNPGHGHHEFGNAETYFLVGDALGKAMIKLLAQQPVNAKEATTSKLPTERTIVKLEGWTIRVDDRLFLPNNEELRLRAMRFLENKLANIRAVVPKDRLEKLQSFTIVLDLSHGKIGPMQYHPGADWLRDNGYAPDLVKCVHLTRAADVATRRNINEQPWVILHELAHAYHDQILTFEDPRVLKAYDNFKKSGRGEKALLYSGDRVRHYGLTDHKEFFAEMTEAYFGVNDFFPFNRAELKESEPEIHELLREIWEMAPKQNKP